MGNAIGYYKEEGIVLVMEWYPSTLEHVMNNEETKSKRFHYTEKLLYCLVDLQSKNPTELEGKLSGGIFTTLFSRKKRNDKFRNWIVHGDLHANNVFIDGSDNLRLGDFGNAKIVKHYCECDKDLLCLLSLLENIWQVYSDGWIPAGVNWLLCELNDLVKAMAKELESGRTQNKKFREKDKLLNSRESVLDSENLRSENVSFGDL